MFEKSTGQTPLYWRCRYCKITLVYFATNSFGEIHLFTTNIESLLTILSFFKTVFADTPGYTEQTPHMFAYTKWKFMQIFIWNRQCRMNIGKSSFDILPNAVTIYIVYNRIDFIWRRFQTDGRWLYLHSTCSKNDISVLLSLSSLSFTKNHIYEESSYISYRERIMSVKFYRFIYVWYRTLLKNDPPSHFSNVEKWPQVTFQLLNMTRGHFSTFNFQCGFTSHRWKVTCFCWSHYIMTPLHVEIWSPVEIWFRVNCPPNKTELNQFQILSFVCEPSLV